MTKNIRNYTSSVPAVDSIQRIEQLLVEAGASHIAKSYVDQSVSGVMFQLMINDLPLTFKLPAKVPEVEKLLMKWPKKRTPQIERRIAAQAERTAWKLVYDWVSIQLSMIRLNQAEPAEIFFPYLFNPATDRTFFAQLKENGFKTLMLEGGKK